MKIFNSVDDTVTFNGRVTELVTDDRQVVLDLWSETEQGTTVTAQATVTTPSL